MGNCSSCCSDDSRSQNGLGGSSRYQSFIDSFSGRSKRRGKVPKPKVKVRDSSLKANADFVAFWDHRASSKGQIEMHEKDEFIQLEANPQWATTVGNWVFVMRVVGDDSAIGYAPRRLLVTPDELETFKWNFGAIDRAQAETILRGTPKGTFLVRSHEPIPTESIYTSPDAMRSYVLSVKFGRECRHYKIIRSIEFGCAKFTISGDSTKYASLYDMIEDLKTGVATDILCCDLKLPARKPLPSIGQPLPVMARETWREISRQRVRMRSEVGRPGSMNALNIGLLSQGPTLPSKVVVVRQLQPSKGALERFLAEAVALKTLNMRSTRFVRIMGVVTVERPFLLVMEYIGEGSLRKYLRARSKAKKLLPEKTLVNICLQIADAMRIMEQQSIVHRTLSTERIFVIEEKPRSSGTTTKSTGTSRSQMTITVKVGGLSLSTALKSSMDPVRASGGIKILPMKWTAPEVLAGQQATVASDVWSFGIMVHEIFTHGNEPYAGMTDDSMRSTYLQMERLIDRDPVVPSKIYDLITKCCRYHAQARLSFSQIYMFLDRYYGS